MALEIERKFLCNLTYEEASKLAINSRRIESIYVKSNEKESLRVVKDTHKNGYVICKWTEKFSQDGLLARIENEERLPEELFQIISQKEYPSVIKERFLIDIKDSIWEVDFFENYDFVIAELEFKTVEEAKGFVDFPEWIVKEVTDDPSYLNCNLATI